MASAPSKAASQSTADSDEARRRFGNAKSISSSMYDEDANKGNDYEKQAMLSKFSVCHFITACSSVCWWSQVCPRSLKVLLQHSKLSGPTCILIGMQWFLDPVHGDC